MAEEKNIFVFVAKTKEEKKILLERIERVRFIINCLEEAIKSEENKNNSFRVEIHADYSMTIPRS